MTVTFTTAKGAKVRSASRRRFVVVGEHTKATGEVSAFVARRSDNIATAFAECSKRGPVAFHGDGSMTAFTVFDSTTGDVA